MDVPKTDYNARNLQWSDRIVRENKVNTRSRSSGFECRKVPSSISAKITRIPGPEQRRRSTMEFMLLKEAASGQTFEFLHQSSAPQSVFLIPQVCFVSYLLISLVIVAGTWMVITGH